jgi:hypothetical protein
VNYADRTIPVIANRIIIVEKDYPHKVVTNIIAVAKKVMKVVGNAKLLHAELT